MNNIDINLDERIVEFVRNNSEESVNIKDKVEMIARLALEKNNIFEKKISVSIQSATKEEIKELNNKYRGIDRTTDVLSFPIFERYEIESLKGENSTISLEEIELGDIILCLDVIKEQSIEYETGLVRETLYMITHGICHLLGYDHIETDEKKEMRALEEEILRDLGVLRKYE